MNKLLFLLPLALAGCNPPPPKTVVQTVYCVTPDQYAKIVAARPPSMKDQLVGQAQKDFITSTVHGVAVQIWGDGMLKILGGCIGPAPSDA